MSRDSMAPSSSSPASAGVSPLGGSYIAATETPGSGSRPFHHQMANITRKDQTGRRTPGLPATNQTTCWVNQEGSFNTPLGIQTSMVRPERGGSGRLDPKLTKLFFFQAEDGIRDPLVTGVHTCALPIYLHRALLHPGGHDQVLGTGKHRLRGE